MPGVAHHVWFYNVQTRRGASNGADVSRGVGVSLTLDIMSPKHGQLSCTCTAMSRRRSCRDPMPCTTAYLSHTAVSRMVLRSSAHAFALLPLPDGARRAPYAMPRCDTRVLVESDDLVPIQVHRCLCTSSTAITLAHFFAQGPHDAPALLVHHLTRALAAFLKGTILARILPVRNKSITPRPPWRLCPLHYCSPRPL